MTVDVVDLAFVVIPVLLVLCLAALEASASRRLGEGHLAVRRAVLVVLLGGAWMAATWQVGETGVLRQWERTPPPLAFLVAAIVTIAGIIAFGPV